MRGSRRPPSATERSELSEPGFPNLRAWIAAGFFLAIVAAAILIARGSQPRAEEDPAPPVREQRTIVPEPPPALNRGDLIDAAARAADAFALGRPVPTDQKALAGRRFSIRLPFGCAGPSAEGGDAPPAGWSYDPEQETLRASFRPEVWTDAGFVRAIAGGAEFEAAEGFWIKRPWIRTGECPPRLAQARQPAGEPNAPSARAEAPAEAPLPPAEAPEGEQGETAPAPAPVRQTLGLVELFEPGSRRAERRNGRPYELVSKIAPGEVDLGRGLVLVVEGRLATLVDGQPVACHAAGADERPVCLIGARIERVAITDSSGERVLAEWAD